MENIMTGDKAEAVPTESVLANDDSCRHLVAGKDAHLLPLIQPVVEGLDYRLVRLRLSGQAGKQRVLQIMVEPQSGAALTLAQCTELSQALSVALDVEDPIAGHYALEVSSAGLARPLTCAQDFITYQGQEVSLELLHAQEERRKYRGTLLGIKNKEVAVEYEGEQQHFALANIKQIALVESQDAIRQSFRNAKRKD